MRAVLILSLGLLAGCDTSKNTKPTTAPEQISPPKKGKSGPQEYVPPPIQKKPVEKTPVEQFADAWGEAEKLSAQMDAAEPAASQKVTATLTGLERMDAEGSKRFSLHDVSAKMTQYGLTAWVARESRKIAFADPLFKIAARGLWRPSSGGDGLLAVMNTWGTIDPLMRSQVAQVVRDNTPTARLDPDTRDTIRTLGGDEWLRR